MKVLKRSMALLLCLAMTLTLFAGLTLTASAATVTDTIKVSDLNATGSSYVSFSGKSFNSDAVYAGSTAKNGTAIQIKKSTAGIYTTTSGGSLESVEIERPSTGTGTIYVYTGSTSSSGSGGTNRGTVGTSETKTINCGGDKHVTIYASGACYITSIKFNWSSGASYTLTASSNGHGTVGTPANGTVTCTPDSGYYLSGASVTAGSGLTVSVSGNTISYSGTQTANAVITATFSPKTAATLTYSENGTTHSASIGTKYVGDSVTLVAPATSTLDGGYEFVGWLPSTYAESDTEPSGLLKAGDSYTLSAASNTLYAVYAIKGTGGGVAGEFVLVESAPDDWSGDYVIANTTDAAYVMIADGSVTGTAYSTASGVKTRANAGITYTASGKKLTGVSDDYVFTVSSAGSGKYYIKMKGASSDLYLISNSTTGSSSVSSQTTANSTAAWTFEGIGAGGNAYLVGNVSRYLGWNSSYFRAYASSNKDTYKTFLFKSTGGGASYSNYTTTVNLEATYYTLDYSANPAAGGTITCASASGASLEEGTNVTLTAAANPHYTFSGWTVDGVNKGSNASLTVNMDSDKTVVANFTAEPTYTVTVTPAAGGTMTASKLTGIYAGETITLTATPDAHYTFNGWQCTAGGASISGNSFTMPAANVTVTGSFTEDTKYTVTFYASSLAADTASALSVQSVYGGESATAPTPGSKDGFSFIGWYTTSGTWSTNPGVLTSSAVNAAAVTADVTYYGVWAEGDNVGGTFKLVVDGKYVGGRTGSNKYLNSVSSEADAAEFGIEDGGYLYMMDGSTKTYVSNKSNATDISFSTSKSDATPWIVTETASGISFTTTATGERELAYNVSSPRFAAYQGNATNYPYIFTKIGGAAASEYTTAPVQVASHTVFWHNGDTYVTTSAKEGTAITTPEEAPTKDDYQETYYTFEGWSATDGGAVVSSYGNMGTSDKHFYAVFTPATYSFTAAISGADSVKVDRSKVLTASLTADPSKDTGDYTVSWTSSDASKVSVDANGRITGLAEGSAVITATYTLLDGTTVTATKTITVLPAAAAGSGYTLITQDNVPEDWTGDYIIMGKIGGDITYMNDWMILTPNYDGGSAVIASNNEDAATITIEDDGSGIGTGTINDEGNASSGVDKSIVMEDTGLVTDTNGDDSILVYDTITEIDDGYAFTIECIDDVNQIYTIRVKDTNLYLSCSANTSTGSNTLAFDSAATERAQWQFSVQRETKGGYNNDIIVAQNMGNTTRRLYFNSNSYGATNGQFRDYHSGAYGTHIGGDTSGKGQAYNLYLFGNPNPFKAQIYYHGEQITLVETGKVNANAQTAQLTGALTPDIDNYPNWTQVGDPAWEIVENSNGNHMTIDSATGLISTNSSTVGSYALVKITYTVHDEVNNVDKLVSTTSKVEVIDADTTYSTVIYELYSGEDTEVQYTVPNSMTELPLAAYVVNDTTDDNSKTGNVVMGGTLNWSITSTSTSMFGTFSIDANGVLHMSNVTKDSIVTVKVTGATGDNMAATAATYKIYVKTADYTLTVVPAADSQGTYDADSDVLTVAGSENSAHLIYNVIDDQGRGPGADTFSLAGYAWTISGESYGAMINSNGLLDFSEMDRSEDHTITAVVSRVAATDAATGTIKSGLTDTITILVKAQLNEDVMEAVDDLVIVDYALPVTYNVLTNDNINITVDVTADTLPTGVVNNGAGSFTFTPNGWLTTDQTYDYTIAGTVNGSAATDTATVKLKTADSVYYEDTYSGIFTFTGDWTDLTDGTAIAQQTSSLDTADIFEYDANREAYAMYSGGTAKTTTVSQGNASRPSVSFTFAGTGFDVISATTNNGGAVLMTIKDAGGNAVKDPETGRALSAIYDNFRGYVYCEEEYTRYTLDQVKRGDWDGSKFTPNTLGNYYWDHDNNEYTTPVNGKWYDLPYDDKAGNGASDATGVDGINLYDDYGYEEAEKFFADYEDASGSFIIKEHQSHWKPYEKNQSAADDFNTNFYQIPIMKITGLPYGTYTVTLTPTYSSAYDRAGDGSYDFIFDGVRIHNPVADREAEYKYINIADAVDQQGMGSGMIVACDHVGYDWSDWTFYSRARNTNSATTNNRGSFVQYCSYCGGVANTAYFHVNVTADDTDLGVGGYMGYPSTTMLRYTLTADACENQAAIQAKLDAMRGSLTEYWSSNTRAIMTCMNNSNVVIASGEGTTYATLQLKDPATQTIYASAIHSPMITVYADETHEHTFGDWTHDADSDPSTHTHTCTGENCSFYETEECVFSEEVTLEPTQTTPGTKTYTCASCGYSYEEEIPALGGFTATFHVPEGATAPAAQTGSSVTMPAAVAAPADYDAHSYTFIGWVESTVDPTTQTQTVYEAGASIDLSADTDFYALYTYGGAAGAYTLSNAAPQAGDSVIIAAKVDGTYYALPQSSFSGEELTVSGNTATGTDGLVWTAYDAKQTSYTGVGFNNGTNPLHFNSSALKVASGDANATLEFTASGDGFIVYSNQNERWLKYNGSSFNVATKAADATPIYFFIAAAGDAYFTTELAKTCKHPNTTTTTVDATCTEAGSETVTCDDCGEVISVTPITALGHYYVPTPAAGGTTYTCSRCGDSYFEADEFEVTYVLQPGVTVSGNSREGNAITLPTSVSIPAAYNAQTYTLVGWATVTAADSETEPTCSAPGAVVNITEDTTFYPVYSYTTTSGGGTTEAGYYLATSVPAVNDNFIIAFKNGDSYYALPNGNKSSGASIAGTALTVNNGKATATSAITFTLISNSGNYGVKSTEAANYLGFNSNKIAMNGWGDTKYATIAAASDGMFTITSTNNSPRGLSYSGTNFTVSNSGASPVYIFTYTEGGTGGDTTTTTYTFELKAASDSYAATLTPATLNMTTGSSASLTATLTNNGAAVAAEDVSFSSSNDNIVMVDENTGYLLAGETAGSATITVEMLAADGEIYTATATINVVEQSDDVTVNYIGSRTGNVYNWGTRGTPATFLTELADGYYTGSYSYDTLSALSGDSGSGTDFYSSALGTAIHNMLTAKQTSTTSYAGTTSLYAYTDCIESGNKISSFYSAALVGPNWDSGSTWNREHTWPNSKGQDGSDENDIMMLRPTAVSENSSRGNNAYGEGSGYYDPNKLGQNLHGDVARLMLQHLMRWGNTSKFYGTGGVMESRAILLKWLAEDPVDTWELGRNDAVQRITGVRNVFVDYPELAFKLLGAEVPANYTTPSASGIVAAATYSASAGSGYEPVTNGTATRSIAPAATEEAPTKGAKRSISAGQFNGIAIIDGMGATNVADDQAAYGPEHGVYLAPGQGIVFSLVSDVTTITSQDLQIGAKAVNGTATQIDVASISNGTESTGIKYLLENKAIASATEMYYELDTTQMGWNNGESSVLVIYNSGSGVLDVTNIRYSTVNGNTLTLNINEAEVQKAAKMIQIVYGEPITDPDPIEPTDPDLNFKSAELVLNSDIAINFNVDEAVMDSADGVFAVFTKALYNEAGEVTGYAEETVFEAIYNEETGLYSFRFTGINPAEMGSAVTAQLFGYRNGELISGKAINYSVLDYINRMYAKTDADSFRTLLADLAAYGAAAQNYVSYNTANLVTAKVADGLMAYATAGAPELSSCTAIRGSGDVEFTAAYLSLREKVTVCYVIDAADYDVADLELRIFDGAKQIGTAAFAEVGGKYVASFSGLNALQMRTVLTAEVYSGDTCVSNTLEYSIESYAAGKAAGNDALAALVNAMMNFGISAETYFAK